MTNVTNRDPALLKARNQLILLFVVTCLLDTGLVIVAQDRWAIARILFTIAVMYFVIQGRRWAKWLLISLCSLMVVALLAMIIALHHKLSLLLIVGSLGMVGLSVLIPVYMLTNQDWHRYVASQRHASGS